MNGTPFIKTGTTWYSEQAQSSTLTQGDLDNVFALYTPARTQEMYLNTRSWNGSQQTTLQSHLANNPRLNGLTFEINVPNPGGLYSQMYGALNWAIDNNRKFFILATSRRDEDGLTPTLHDMLISSYKEMYFQMRAAVGESRFRSRNLTFVPAVYNWFKKEVHHTPEVAANGLPANTGTGVAKFLLDQRSKYGIKVTPSDASDLTITAASGQTGATGAELSVGSRGGTGRNALMMFALPVLLQDQTIESATPEFTVSSILGTLTASHQADLWALGIVDSTAPPTNYLAANLEGGQSVVGTRSKLQDEILTSAVQPMDRVYSDATAAFRLTQYLLAFYQANPTYTGGKFLALRVNQDTGFGAGDIGWNIAASESPPFNALPLAMLNLKIVPTHRQRIFGDNFDSATAGLNDNLATRQSGTRAPLTWSGTFGANAVIAPTNGVDGSGAMQFSSTQVAGGGSADLPDLVLGSPAANFASDLGSSYRIRFDIAYSVSGTPAANDRIIFLVTPNTGLAINDDRHHFSLGFGGNRNLALLEAGAVDNTGVTFNVNAGNGQLIADGVTFNAVEIEVDETAGRVRVFLNGVLTHDATGVDFSSGAARSFFFSGRDVTPNVNDFTARIDQFRIEKLGSDMRVGTIAAAGANLVISVDGLIPGNTYHLEDTFDLLTWSYVPASQFVATVNAGQTITFARGTASRRFIRVASGLVLP